jgi:hypothetical protein
MLTVVVAVPEVPVPVIVVAADACVDVGVPLMTPVVLSR